MEFDKLCIYPIKGVAKHILYTAEYISNGKNLEIKPIDSSFNNKQIAYCPQLSYGIISFDSFVDIETMSIISSDVEVNEYEFTGTKFNELVNALKQLGLPHIFAFIRQLLLRQKLRPNNLGKEIILSLRVNKKNQTIWFLRNLKKVYWILKE